MFAKQPFGGPVQVIEYLGRYTHKVAISNHRITAIENGNVSFRYKDYADGGKQKEMTISATEFLRRFCMHILPKGFRKIRHYGFLSNRCSQVFKQQQLQMGIVIKPQSTEMKEVLSFDNNGPPKWAINKIQSQLNTAEKFNVQH